MKALIYSTYGQPEDIFKIENIEKPIPEDDEILVKIYNTTVNRTDEGTVTARYFISRFFSGLLKPKRQTPGTDFSGIIESVGNKVTLFKEGDRVFGFDDEGLSSHAEYLTINEQKGIALIPNNINFPQAAASIEGMHYAINFSNKVNLKKGDQILVNGATGAIGSAMIQLLKYYGCHVSAVANTKNIELIQSLGIPKVIDYQKEDFTKIDVKFDYIFDAVGKSSFAKCKSLLKPKGAYISSELGKRGANIFLALVTPLFYGKKVLFPMPKDIKTSILLIREMLKSNSFMPVLDSTHKFEDIIQAYTYVQTGQKTGNVIIQMNQ